MLIRLDQFGGIAPKIASHLLPDNLAVTANNCRFGSGALEPLNQASTVATPTKVGTKKSIYKYGNFWFHWLEDVNIVQAPVALDAYGRVYWTGESYPRVGGSDVVTTGGTNYPTASYRMGVPPPAAAPTTAVNGDPSDNLPPVARSYVYTYVTEYGAEGPPSNPTAEVDVANGQTVTVTMAGAPVGNYNVTLKNIYRTVKGSSETVWLLVGTVPVATSTFVDNKLDSALSIDLPSLLWDAPPDDMKGLCAHPMGSLCGFSGKELILSVPYRPHAWPYRYAVADPIVAIGVYGTSILVTTTGAPYVISGSDPSAMSMERLEKGEACVSKRGLVDMGPACVYPGPSGLWGVGMGDVALLTGKVMDLADWTAYKPDSIMGCHHDGSYIGFYDNGTKQGGFVFDPATGDFSTIDLYATAAWNDPKTGALYLVVGSDIVKWEGTNSPYSVTWKSKLFQAPAPLNLSCGRVLADSYPVTLRVYADGVLKHTQTVANAYPFRLPAGFRAIRWQAEVLGAVRVTEVSLANAVTELR